MSLNRALVLSQYGGADAVKVDKALAPTAQAGQVVVRVRAAGINGIDWKVREGWVKDAFPLDLPVVLGIELAGIVEEVGPGVTALRKGDRVFGALGGVGAYADLVAVNAANLARVPDGLDFVQAAALPIASVAAWQSLNFAGLVAKGQRILIQGAAGGLGGFAVQFAHQAGAEVFATALSSDVDYVKGLGADHVIAYDKEKFEDTAQKIDLVLDYVGGETLARSWSVLVEGGAIVSTASPAILGNIPAGYRGLWFMNKVDAERLQTIAQEVARGHLKSKVGAVVRFADLPAAIERNRTEPQLGKTVVDFTL
jgi:NADPH:quinone reductase-like Zn-dependent oxidoreductase